MYLHLIFCSFLTVAVPDSLNLFQSLGNIFLDSAFTHSFLGSIYPPWNYTQMYFKGLHFISVLWETK
jgi:hypothetical protein